MKKHDASTLTKLKTLNNADTFLNAVEARIDPVVMAVLEIVEAARHGTTIAEVLASDASDDVFTTWEDELHVFEKTPKRANGTFDRHRFSIPLALWISVEERVFARRHELMKKYIDVRRDGPLFVAMSGKPLTSDNVLASIAHAISVPRCSDGAGPRHS